MDYETLKVMASADPKGKKALAKFLETASEEQLQKLRTIITDTPAALEHFASALRALREEMETRGLL